MGLRALISLRPCVSDFILTATLSSWIMRSVFGRVFGIYVNHHFLLRFVRLKKWHRAHTRMRLMRLKVIIISLCAASYHLPRFVTLFVSEESIYRTTDTKESNLSLTLPTQEERTKKNGNKFSLLFTFFLSSSFCRTAFAAM